MKKTETIRRRGLKAYERDLSLSKIWARSNPERTREYARRRNRPGGKYYMSVLRKNTEGLRHERANRRGRDGAKYRHFKKFIDPLGQTQVHHSWYVASAECEGVALVEKNQHQHGFIDVIEILEGEITVFTEQELRVPENMEVPAT